MDHDFWLKAWTEGRTAFHQESASPFLVKYTHHLNIKDHQHVLLPLCGKTLDLLYFEELGLKVTGIELSPLAVEQFKSEHPREYTVRDHSPFTVHQHNELSIWRGDFFDFTPEKTSPIDFIFDRAAMVALPFELRKEYAQHLNHFVEKGAKLMLVTIEYPQDKIQGPPFSVSTNEVKALYQNRKIEILERKSMEARGEKFVQAGVHSMDVVCTLISKN